MSSEENFCKLLDTDLDEKHSRYKEFREYSLNSIKRGKALVDIVANVVDVTDKKIVDLGCGDGGVSIAFALVGADVVGVDLNEKKVQMARARAKDNNVIVDFRTEDGINTSLEYNKYDIVISSDVLEHVRDPLSYLKEANRLLKKDGLLVLSCSSRFSIKNILSDPHYGLFGISAIPPKLAEYYTVNIRKITKEFNWYQYFTYKDMQSLLEQAGFSNDIINEMIKNFQYKIANVSVVGSPTWRSIATCVKKLRVDIFMILLIKCIPSLFAPSISFITIKTSTVSNGNIDENTTR